MTSDEYYCTFQTIDWYNTRSITEYTYLLVKTCVLKKASYTSLSKGTSDIKKLV